MYCPKCGTESSAEQRFCRSCGSNLKVIGKAVALGEVIARSDRGPMLKFKEMMESAKIKKTTDDVSQALDKMGQDISEQSAEKEHQLPWWMQFKDTRTPEQRREHHLVKGTVAFFSGIGLMIFLYYLSAALVLKIPPETLAKLPFELDPVVKMIWLVGLIPALSGLGRIIAGLMIKIPPHKSLEEKEARPALDQRVNSQPSINETAGRFIHEGQPGSVTEHTTEMLDQKIPIARQ
jgi:zinc-ribbon domain